MVRATDSIWLLSRAVAPVYCKPKMMKILVSMLVVASAVVLYGAASLVAAILMVRDTMKEA